MKKNILITIIACISLVVGAQNVKKGYKNLEKGEYAKAKETFKKNLAENNDHVASNFGMAMILADEKSSYFNIVDSWAYIEKVSGRASELNQEELEILAEYFLATEIRKTSRPVKKKLDIAVEAVESRLIKFIREENNLEAVYAVLEKYPDFRHYDNVVHIRNQFEYRKYEKLNTFTGYLEFIEKFPDAAQVPKAEKNRNKMAFEEAKATNTVASYNKYIREYPESIELQQAIKLRNEAAYAVAKGKNTLLAYESFIALYPDALQIPEAKKQQRELMYQEAKRVKTLEAYNEFIRMYPEGGYYVDVFNLKAEDLGKQYLAQSGFTGTDLLWAKAFDNNEFIDKARAIKPTADGGFVIAGTTQTSDTAFSDAWIVKLDHQGKMLWNKTIGQPYNDKVQDLFINSKNEIVVIGKTQIASDSAQFMAWMFLLEDDGTRKWNKNLGDMKIASADLASNDRLYMATYVSDTIEDKLFIQAMDVDGKKIWERDYIRKGIFKGLNFTGDDNVVLAGSNWLNLSDSKFYIEWEDTLKIPGLYKMADINDENIALIYGDSLTTSLVTYSMHGNKTAQTTISTDQDTKLKDVLITKNNEIIIPGFNATGGFVNKYSITGLETGNTTVGTGLKVVSIVTNSTGGVTYLLKGKDYIVLNYSSDGF